MIRVLQVYPQLNNAGTEMVIMNLYRNIDRTLVQFDFLVQKKGELDSTISGMGGVVHYIPYSSQYEKTLMEFFSLHPEYQIVHTHTHKEMGIVLRAAKKTHIPVRIAHSHNSRADLPKFAAIIKRITSYPIEKNATHFIACSPEAAEWLFPRKHNRCLIWKNGIDLIKFSFNPEARTFLRNQYGIPEDATIICHVGRFARQKNHERILSIINQLIDENPSYFAFLVGVGPLMDEMKSKVHSDHVFFLGNRNDIPDILSASDIFLFPSLWEGLGIVAIEAQANGLPCVASDRVPLSADLNLGLLERISLDRDDRYWEMAIIERVRNHPDRMGSSNECLNSDYNIKEIAKTAQEFYCKNGEVE